MHACCVCVCVCRRVQTTTPPCDVFNTCGHRHPGELCACMPLCVHAVMRVCSHACMQLRVHAVTRACSYACMQLCVNAVMRACSHSRKQSCAHRLHSQTLMRTCVQIILMSALTIFFAALGFLSPANRGSLMIGVCVSLYCVRLLILFVCACSAASVVRFYGPFRGLWRSQSV